MLSILIIQLFITFCCICAGFIFYDKLDKRPRTLMIHVITGLILITIIAQVIALFIPVKVYFFVSLFLILLIYAILNIRVKNYFFSLAKQLKALPVLIK